MTNLIANLLGAGLAVLFVGFFAISVGRPALLIIVGCCLAVMAVAIYQDVRDKWQAR